MAEMQRLPELNLFSKFTEREDKLNDWFAPEETTPGGAVLLNADLKDRLKAKEAANAQRAGPAAPQKTATKDGDEDEGDETPVAHLGSSSEVFFGFSEPVKKAPVATHATFSFDVKRRRGKAKTITREVPLWSISRLEAGMQYSSNAMVSLHQEIMDFVEFMSPTPEEIFLRRQVDVQIAHIAAEFWPGSQPIVYGSMATGLLLPLSDIDMTILNVPVGPDEALTLLAKQIAAQGLCTNMFPQVILKTKVPLVKFTHKKLQVEVDISINAGDGQVNTNLVRSMLQEYPEARPLIIVLKCFLKQREQHEPFKGGMGSFALTILVISFLQNHPISVGSEDRTMYGLGRLLVDFFYFYAHAFNFQRVGISLEKDGWYFLKPAGAMEPINGRPAPPVLAQDPGNPSNNAASSLRNFREISQMFHHAWMSLTGPFTASDGSPSSTKISERPTLLSRVIHPDPALVLRREAMAAAFEEVKTTASDMDLEEIRAFKPEMDAFLLDPQSWFRQGRADELIALSSGAAGGRKRGRETDNISNPTSEDDDGADSVSSVEYVGATAATSGKVKMVRKRGNVTRR